MMDKILLLLVIVVGAITLGRTAFYSMGVYFGAY
jgi:hypothetical protein